MTASTVSRRTCWRALAALAFAPLPVLARERIPAGAVDVRSFGAKGDGVTDDSDALARAHNSGAAVFYPRTDAYYRITRATKIRGSALSDGATLRQIQDGSTGHSFFDVMPAGAPITVSGFVMEGQHGSTLEHGEWSTGINIRGACDVTITNNVIANMGGDCVYLASSQSRQPPQRIDIANNRLVNPHRCNVAIVCGEHVSIRNNALVKTSDYVSAIDLEPNPNGTDFVRNITIADNTFDMKSRFITAGVNNGIANTGLVVRRNKGTARLFFLGYPNALLLKPRITENIFMASRSEACMFDLRGVRDIFIALNKDRTPCRAGYRSTRLHNTTATLSANQFC